MTRGPDPGSHDRAIAAGSETTAKPAKARRRVRVRGVGAITPLGADWPTSRAALMRGETAVAPVRTFDVRGFPSTVAAAIDRSWPDEDRRRPLALADRKSVV